MGKKNKQATKSSAEVIKPGRQVAEKKDPSIIVRWLLAIAVIMMYGASVNFNFTLDDDMFYLKHQTVQKGLSDVPELFKHGSLFGFDGTTGVQPYRPFTLLVFAVQKELFNNSPAMAHLINVLLYLLMVQLIFTLLRKIIPGPGVIIPAGMALLFAVHPIHTEVVSNIKSMDELLVGVLGISAWLSLLPKENRDGLGWKDWLKGSIFFLLALLSKESAIAFMVIIPLSIYMLSSAGIRRSLLTMAPLAVVSALFLLVRHNVVGTEPASSGIPFLENVLNGAKGWAELWATKFEILFYYIKLLFVPWPLNWDYSYNQIPLVNWDSPLAIAGLLIYGGLFVLALLQFRKNPVLAFSILFFFIASAPTNNIFFNNGATVGERFLFVPSLGYAIGLIWVLGRWKGVSGDEFMRGSNKLFSYMVAGLCILFALLSFNRSADWKNNLSLFERGVERSPNSSRAQYSIATEYMTQAQRAEDPAESREFFRKATVHFAKSTEIYPQNVQAHYNSGICYTLLKDTSRAIFHYRKCVEYDKDYEEAMNNLGVLYQGRAVFDSAQYYYELGLAVDPKARKPLQNLSDLFGMKGAFLNRSGDREGAIASYKKCLEYNANNIQALNNLASIYSGMRAYDSALVFLERAYALDTRAMMVIENIAAVSYLSGKYIKAIEYANKALAIDNRSRKSYGVLADTYQAMGNTKEAARYRALYDQPR